MTALDDRLLPVFARQHWLASLEDVRDAGGSSRSASRRVASGRWEHVDVSVFRLAGAPRPWESRVLAPILGIGSGALASHTSAARLHGMPGFGPGAPEVTVARSADHRRRGVIMHTSTDLERCTPVVVDGVPSTDVDRTLLDLARTTGDARLLRHIEWARREDRTDWSTLISTLARHARRGRPGIRRLRRVIVANMDRDEVTDSDFELLVLALLAEVGLPTPVLHYRVHHDGRFVAEVDLAYPDARVVIELDGSVHLHPEVRERDLVKQNDLVLAGWTVLRFSYGRYRRYPERVATEIRAALAAAVRVHPR
jgi:predicted transcriptional regulator of viral defense system